MHFRKIISLWTLLALMLGQVILAEHSASHIDHGFSQEVIASHDGHDEREHDHGNKKHECHECLLTKSLQTASYDSSVTLPFILFAETLTPNQRVFTVSVNRSKAHSPRAPPSILI